MNGREVGVESWPDVAVTAPSTHRHEVFLPVPSTRAESVRKDPEGPQGEAVIRPWTSGGAPFNPSAPAVALGYRA
jgi:hypothetical protein